MSRTGATAVDSAARWSAPRFATWMMLWYTAMHAAYFAVPDVVLREQVYALLTRVGAALVNLLQPLEAARADANLLVSGRAVLEIVRGCDGSGAMFMLTAALLAAPLTARVKGAGLVAGVVLVLLLNQARITGLYFVAAYQPGWFLPLHAYVVPSLLVLAVLLHFLCCCRYDRAARAR